MRFHNVSNLQQELEPRKDLYDLLIKFKDVCDKLQQNDDIKLNLVQNLTTLNNEVWEVEDRKIAKRVMF